MTNETKRQLSDRQIQQLERREKIREDGLDFWAEREGWPINAPGKIYLLEAIEAEGKRLFGTHWTGREQVEQFYPILLDDADVASGGFEEIYAINLLGTYRPDLGRLPVIGASNDIYRNPLSSEEWTIAFSIFKDVVSPERNASGRRLRAAINSIHTRLIQGDLEAWSRSLRGFGEFRLIDQGSWTIDIVMARFLFGLFDPHEPSQDETLKSAPHRIKTSQLPEKLWPEFIFLDADKFFEKPDIHSAQAGLGGAKLKTRQDVENLEVEAKKIYCTMSEDGRVKRREFEARCLSNGIKSTISRSVFSQLNTARPGQRD